MILNAVQISSFQLYHAFYFNYVIIYYDLLLLYILRLSIYKSDFFFSIFNTVYIL